MAAIDGDPIALGWITTTHRPLLISHGRALLERDASEWGAVCLEQLQRKIVYVNYLHSANCIGQALGMGLKKNAWIRDALRAEVVEEVEHLGEILLPD